MSGALTGNDEQKEEKCINRHLMTRLGKGLDKAYKSTGATSLAQFCDTYDVPCTWITAIMRNESEPKWMRNLRNVKRASGFSWDDILGGSSSSERVKQLERAMDTSTRRVDELCTENEKLRKLALDLYYLSDTYFEDRELYWWKPYEQRMRDLGIEVDE